MILLPLVERGLRLAARRGLTHWLRLGAAGLAFGGVIGGLVVFRAFGGGQDGAGLFRFVAWLAWGFVLFEGVRQTADCVSSERREGTLGLLLLTALRPRDVVLGKLLPAALHTVYAVLAMMPVLGLALLLGGVTGGELARVAVALLVSVGLTLAAGVTASVLVEEATQAWVGAVILAGLFAAVSGPLLAHAFALQWAASQRPFWLLLLAAVCLIVGAVALAGRNLRMAALDADAPPEPYALPELKAAAKEENDGEPPVLAEPVVDPGWRPPRARSAQEGDWLEESPALWLALRQDHGGAVFLMCVAGFFLGFGSLALLGGTQVVFGILLACCYGVAGLMLAWEGCRRMAELRRSGMMELLATTPLAVPELLQGFRLGLRRRYQRSVQVIVIVQLIAPAAMFAGGEPVEAARTTLLLLVINGWFILELIAVTLVALYYGFALGSPGAAFGRTILWMVVVPCLALPLSAVLCLWPLVLVLLAVKPVLVILWASKRLELDLPRLATEPLDIKR